MEENLDDCEDIIVSISEKALERALGKNAKPFIAKIEEDCPPVCLPATSERACLIKNFSEEGGINNILEDAIQYYANSVEKRLASIVRLQTFCIPERENLHKCVIKNRDCSYKCNPEMEAFMQCVNKVVPMVVDSKVKIQKIDLERSKIIKEMSQKYQV